MTVSWPGLSSTWASFLNPLPPNHPAAVELLRNRAGDHRAEREAQTGHPHAHTESGQRRRGGNRHPDREEKRVAQVRQRRLAPRQERPDAGEEQQDEADWHHPLVEERARDRE